MNWKGLTQQQKNHIIARVWRDGISASELATALGTTRGSIVGHYSRHKNELASTPLRPYRNKGGTSASTLRRRRIAAGENTKRPTTQPRLARLPSFPVEPIPVVASDYGLHVTMMDNNGCSWPTNDGGPYTFCGHTRLGLYSYCAVHHERSRGRGTESERRALSGIRANA